MAAAKTKSQPVMIVAAAVCALAGAALFHFHGNANRGYIATDSLFWWWGYQWWNPASETEHGWLILGISAWLLWRSVWRMRNAECGARIDEPTALPTGAARPIQSEAIPHSAIRTPHSSVPLAAMVAGLGLHAVGFAAQQARVSIVALLLFTWGVLRLGGGPRWGRAAVFPLAFLMFAIPVNVLDSIGFWLRLWVIDATAAIAGLADIKVVQNGTQLLSPDGRYHYDVAAACSGVRSLMALAALSLLIGYLNFRSWWRRGVILLLCLPLVYVGNVARIAAIVLAADAGGTRWGDMAHAVMGYAIFVIVLGGVLAAAVVLRRVAPETADEGRRRAEEGGGRGAEEGRGRGARVEWVAAVVVAVVVGEAVFLHRIASRPARGGVGIAIAADGANPVELPAILGREWVGWPAEVTAIEREVLPPDTGFSRMRYISSRDRRGVLLSVVLSGRDRTSIHRPELCLLGQGWTITSRARHEFSYPGRPCVAARAGEALVATSGSSAGEAPARAADAEFPATVLRVTRAEKTPAGTVMAPQLVAYWFVGADRIVGTHWERIAEDAWKRLVHGRADRWAYVLMQTDAADGEPAALARMQAVLDGTLPVFQPARR